MRPSLALQMHRVGTVTYDGMMMARCVQELETSECDGDLQSLFDFCDGAFVGTVAPGGVCQQNEVCSDDNVCRFAGSCPGSCGPVPSIGEACTDNTGCTSGLLCLNDRCIEPQSIGETCDDNLPCEPGLVCKAADIAAAILDITTCVPFNDNPVGANQTCDLIGGPFCQSGLSCVLQPAQHGRVFLFSKCVKHR